MDVNVNLQNEATTQHQPNLRQRILVADDDPAIRRLNSEALLRSGYTFEELLETVKNVLHANADARGEIAPPPNWQGQPLPNGLRL